MRWISVRQRMPPCPEDCFLMIDGKRPAVGGLSSKMEWWETVLDEMGDECSQLVSGDVTHWMPIPELPGA